MKFLIKNLMKKKKKVVNTSGKYVVNNYGSVKYKKDQAIKRRAKQKEYGEIVRKLLQKHKSIDFKKEIIQKKEKKLIYSDLQIEIRNNAKAIKDFYEIIEEKKRRQEEIGNNIRLHIERKRKEIAIQRAENANGFKPNISTYDNTSSKVDLIPPKRERVIRHARNAFDLSKLRNWRIMIKSNGLLNSEKHSYQHDFNISEPSEEKQNVSSKIRYHDAKMLVTNSEFLYPDGHMSVSNSPVSSVRV